MSSPVMQLPLKKLINLGLKVTGDIHYQLSPEELASQCVQRHEGILTDTGALSVNTGEFTGRCPKDRYLVRDDVSATTVDWNNFNQPIGERQFDQIFKLVTDYLNQLPEIWVRDSAVCADPEYRLQLRVITETPAMNLFAYNMFLRPEQEGLKADWHILAAPGLKLDPEHCGIRQQNAVIISLKKQVIILAGTGYTGEIKKSVFSVLNYLLPFHKQVLGMHCAANMGRNGDTAIFFGLSGTGKTTLSADRSRMLIGDDEHGWTDKGIFNFEGGCYAKCIHLKEENEPDIFRAIRSGALLENTGFFPGTNHVNYEDASKTENTRVSYPLDYIPHSVTPSIGINPSNIFFLTCDASGVLPPISRLTPEQAMYQFISGYTAKIAGTEAGITEPKSTFSACFGAPFLPLHPGFYARMLGEKIRRHQVRVWLVNTGWSGGAYGKGERIPLSYTRSLVSGVLEGRMGNTNWKVHPVFHFAMPETCPGVPDRILDPENTWKNPKEYQAKARELAMQFIDNFKKYENQVPGEILNGAPDF
ncbi:MAG: phosphoenolpyruvate carboxykinase (ATP) [Bacteroidota bacterium]|nr:phosphoenolpyruvate carboxykinase (ATP) [Bacteroidota bacterium]MDP4211471.1 phosphoenolpyruvate carboxykinase (ATP) [Bacteroidota bacterium]MDP4249820.1 phosphoenolpyruvate carboxykinase (ATP) [Bacteroidota bacterium]